MTRSTSAAAAISFATAVLISLLAATADALVTVTAPLAGSSSASATSDAPTLVGTDTWTVTSDEAAGATLVITAPSFEHTVETGNKAAIQLNLTKLSGTQWSVGTGESTSTNTVSAQVTATSAAAGDGSFSVNVRFVPGDISILPNGTYSTTITGTIIAN